MSDTSSNSWFTELHSINGLHLCCRQRGPTNAPVIVCLHGLMDNGASFVPLIDALAPMLPDKLFWLAPDWRGHGDSDWAPGDYIFAYYLADLDALIARYAGNRPIIVIAHSMGGQVASLYAGIRREKIAGLILLDSLNVPEADPDDAPARYREWLDTRAAPPTARTYADADAFVSRLARRYPELPRRDTLALADIWLRRDTDDRLRLAADPAHLTKNPYGFRAAEAMAAWADITAPVLMLDGAASPAKWFIDEPTREKRRAQINDLTHIELADLGHMLHWQAPVQVADPIAHFLSSRALVGPA